MRIPCPSIATLSLAFLLLGGCASAPPRDATGGIDSVAVLGVTVREGVEGFNRAAATRALIELAGEGGRRTVVPPARARAALGEERLRALTERHARDGVLDPAAREWLVQARLGTRFALITRIDEDSVTSLPERYGAVRDTSGRVLRDRTAVHMGSERTTVVSVELIDLADGSSRYRRFVAQPRTSRTYTRYFGSSFSGSVAASLANRMVAGEARPPAPPSRHATLRALLGEAVRVLPDV